MFKRKTNVILTIYEDVKFDQPPSSIFGKCWLPRHDLSTVETPAAGERMGRCVVILVVTNSSGKLGQVTPHIPPSPL